MSSPGSPTAADVRAYWNQHIHDLDISREAPGTPGFFADLDQYHFEKLHHLLRLVDFEGYRGKRVLDVGCGAGTDLVRFARAGAIVSGVDLSAAAVWRPKATQNIVMRLSAAALLPGKGFRDLFDNSNGNRNYYSVLANVILSY